MKTLQGEVHEIRDTAQAASSLGAAAQLIASGQFKREYRDHRLEWMIKTGGLQVVLDGLAKDNIRFSPEFE